MPRENTNERIELRMVVDTICLEATARVERDNRLPIPLVFKDEAYKVLRCPYAYSTEDTRRILKLLIRKVK